MARILEPIANGRIEGTALPQEVRFARFTARGACTAWQDAQGGTGGSGADAAPAVAPETTGAPISTLPPDPLLPQAPQVDENGIAVVGRLEIDCRDVLADMEREQADLEEAESAGDSSESAAAD